MSASAAFKSSDLFALLADMSDEEREDYKAEMRHLGLTARRGSSEREWSGLVLAILGIEERAPGAIEAFNSEDN